MSARRQPYWYHGRRLEIVIDGQRFRLGHASGEGCNCLIDTLRQKIGVACNVAPVRKCLEEQHRHLSTRIVPGAFLALDLWYDIINLIWQHGEMPQSTAHCVERLRIVCADLTWVGNGEALLRGPLGQEDRVLHIARVNENHFVPLFPPHGPSSSDL